MTLVRRWQTDTWSSGTSTVADSVLASFPGQHSSGATLLRTLVGVTCTAGAGVDPVDNGSAHSLLIAHFWQSSDGSGPDGSWPFAGTESDSTLSVPLAVTGVTVLPQDTAASQSQSVHLHYSSAPTLFDSKAQRKITADFGDVLYYYVGGAETSPQSGLALSIRLWVSRLFQFDV